MVPEGVMTERLAGFLYATRHHANIFVEQDDRLTRRRFSAAHELGHLLLHVRPFFATSAPDDANLLQVMEVLPRGDQDDEAVDSSGAHLHLPEIGANPHTAPDTRLVLEQEADTFAGALLMPADVIGALVVQYGSIFHGADLIWRLASDLLVSRAAMRRRLLELGVLSSQSRGLN
jgi:Zn-dependent peptidase ImmA (M78 family)